MLNMNVPKLISVRQLVHREFVSKPSSFFGESFNPNPDFFQHNVDAGFSFDAAEVQCVPAPEEAPWYVAGYAMFFDGKAYLVGEEYEDYTEIAIVGVELRDWPSLVEALEPINSFFQAVFDMGVKSGRVAKALEIKNALAVD